MALFVDVKNVSGGARVVVVDGDRHEVANGATVKASAAAAGTAPRWRRADVDDDGTPTEPLEQLHTRIRAGHVEVFDLGSGLLAQQSLWRKAGDESEPADPADGGGGELIDVTATGGQFLVSPAGERGPEQFVPETSGAALLTTTPETETI
jgi:hypothetical protein